MDVGALGYESVRFLKQSAAPREEFIYILSLPHSKTYIIVLSEDVDNCVCVSLRVYHHVYA